MSHKIGEQRYTQTMTETVADVIAFHRARGGDIGFREVLLTICRDNDMMGVYDRYMTGELDLDECVVDVFNDGTLELFDPNRQEEDDE